MKLSFDRFDLGLDGCNSENIKDYVEVLDGKELDSESKGKFCDRTIPPVIRSSGRHMRVVFVSDSYGPFYTGFKATYTAVEKKGEFEMWNFDRFFRIECMSQLEPTARKIIWFYQLG